MGQILLYGASYSVYTRIARLVMAEIGVPYQLVEVDIFAQDTLPADYLDRHPFGKIPALEHDGFRLFETDAIAHYVIAAQGDRSLIPQSPRERARVTQVMRIMDHYGYPFLVWGLFVEEVERDRSGPLSEAEIAKAENVLKVLDGLMAQPYFLGDSLTLADLWAAPMLAYLELAPTGRALLSKLPNFRRWSGLMRDRPSVQATRFPKETE